MSDQWDFYRLLVDDMPASIFVDLGIASGAPLVQFPNLAFLSVRMQQPRPDGLSSQDEYEALIALEDGVSESIGHSGRSIYVGRNTCGGHRDFYFYTDDSTIEAVLRNAMAKWPDYEFETGTRADADWSVYWNFLYPSAEDFQRISNRNLIDKLREHGDQIEAPRKIDHFAIFKTQSGSDGFVSYLRSNGYNISHTTGASGEQFDVAFDRVDQPSRMDEVTIELHGAALGHNGEYDGWGCSIVK
ncbi:DUF695 domain-containing protein [Dyella mobilis]|uniref:DUF695 domain-containing protein n=1 Tax=Dyella mobilis TaxID=1849582 RepID=A0ABS2KIB9_9GAMM|nr:DUF695 domain-containing protein [Dyella mobilis]MBM7130790.1 DUF695 domain-containing protein [Dyella mobilis]GLQ97419.1 hypothetical protein GCM10007863_18390 [Dyella mobilis]